MLQARAYTKRDYGTVEHWWKSAGHAVLLPELLSDTGIVVESSGRPTAAAWLYLTNSRIGILGWVVARPDARLRERYMSVDLALAQLILLSKRLNVQTLIGISGVRSVTRIMVNLGLKRFTSPHELLITGVG